MSDVTYYFLFLVAVHSLGSLQFGYHIGEMNTPQAIISCQTVTDAQLDRDIGSRLVSCMKMTDIQYGSVVSLFTIGGLIGSFFAGRLSDKYGRRPVGLVNCLFFVLGPLMMSTANAMWSLGAGRLVSGVASGVALVLTPIYLNEISPLAIRGTVGAMTQVSCVFGILIAQIAGVYFSTATGWRLILGFGGMIGFVQFILLWFTVESPKWLTSQPGEFAHAKYLLRKIRGRSDIESEMRLWKGEDEDEEVSATMEHRGLLYVDLHSSVHSEDEVRSTMSLGTFLTDTKLRPAVRAIFITQFAQQFTGTNAVVFYSTSILASLLPDLSAWISVGISLVNFLVTLVAANLVDRAGRKILILTSIAGMAISSALLAVGINGDYKVLSAVAAASIIGSFGLGLGPVPFLLISEYFEAETVGIAQSLGISVSWAATFTVGFLFPVMKQNLGGSSFYVFAVSAVLFFFLTLRYVPESKGKTVREIWLTT